MTWKLWLDDVRDPPSDEWTVARSADTALDLVVEHGAPKEMSLDYDLDLTANALRSGIYGGKMTSKAPTGLDFLVGLKSILDGAPPPGWRVHSANPDGRKLMEALLCAWTGSV